MVNHTEVTGFLLDNLAQFSEMLIQLQQQQSDLFDALVVWKSDIAEAYRLCPMHPLWQIKQAVCVGSEFFIDRCNAFGNSASGSIFIVVNGLVLGSRKRNVAYLLLHSMSMIPPVALGVKILSSIHLLIGSFHRLKLGCC